MDMYTFCILLAGWGLGVVTVSIAWGVEKRREGAELSRIMRELFQETSVGHVIDYHQVGATRIHAHCICGEESLTYNLDDPTADRLMEQWAENHIDARMESAGR